MEVTREESKQMKQGTGKPHVHAELIKAWADGAEIQYKPGGKQGNWLDCLYPTWDSCIEYRIKPKTIKYRLYLYQSGMRTIIQTANESDRDDATKYRSFIRWMGDWQEVEV